MGGGEAGGAHKGAVGDADAGELLGYGPTVGDLPVDGVGFGEQVAEEAGAGAVAGPAVGLGDDVEVFDFEEVAGLGAGYVDRAG